MKNVVKKTLLNIKPYIPGKPIEEVKRELGLNNVIKLASNENPYGPSPKVRKAIADTARKINRYPDGDCFYLRQILADHLKVRPRQIIFGNGSDEIIVLAVRAFVDEGDEVIIAQPSFLIYDIASQIAGAHVRAIPLKEFRYNLTAMKRAVTGKTKIIFLGNPDNPSGTFIAQTDIIDFLKGLRKDILVFIDEAYYEYVIAKDYGNSLELLKNYKNVIVTRTFSKMYGLAGLRVGYGVANEELIDLLNRIREPFNVNSIAQAAATACLKDKTYYRGIAKKVEGQRQFLYKNFQEMGLQFQKSYTNFILLNVQKDSSEVSKQLLKKGVIIRDMNVWGLKNYIRVTIGTEPENRRFISALRSVL